MREIRFRAWDKENKKWVEHSSDVRIEVNNSMIYHLHQDNGSYYGNCGHIELMQSTGLKDNNGKEIFEGDIVEFPPFNKDYCEGEYLPRQRFTVDLSQLRLWLKEERFGYEGELLLDNDICKIIGNIYENPFLLKEIKST